MTAPEPHTPPTPGYPLVPVQPILAPDPRPLNPWQRWVRFWFPRADPTTLAFVRVCTGLLVFYIHLAYSLDLQNFFGKHGWYAQSFIDRERHESPSYIQPFWGPWSNVLHVAQLSEFPHRRQAFLDFLRSLPADERDREMALRYINRAAAIESPENFHDAWVYVQMMQTSHDLENYLKVLDGQTVFTADKSRDITEQLKRYTPPAFISLPKEERLLIAVEVKAFWTTLANTAWTEPNEGRRYVFNGFMEAAPETRKTLVDYMNTLPKDPNERKQLLDYLDYWNSDPRKANRLGSGIFSVWFHVTDPTAMAAVHTGVLVVIFMFTIGLFTRVTSVLVWLATVGYIHRTQQVLFGMDTMMNILLFYLMIGNSGAALSVDRLIARYRASRASLRRCGTLDAPTRAFLGCPPPSASAGFALRLIQVHFCFIYVAAGLSKLKGAAWWEGRAFWDVIANPEFTLMPYSWYEGTLRWIASIKPLYYTTTIISCWVTLFVEIAGPFLLWTRLRWFMIFFATLMHAIIAVLMGLNLFELLMIIMLVAFMPDRCIRDRFRGGPDLPRLTLTFNPAVHRQEEAVATAVAVDVDNQIALDPDSRATAVTVSPGPTHGSQEGLATLFRNVRLLAAVGFLHWLPGVRTLLAHRLFPKGGDAESKKNEPSPFKPPTAAAKR